MNDLAKQAMSYYHQALLQSDEARIYLEKRGVYDEAAIKHFELGFSNGSFTQTLPHRDSSKGIKVRRCFRAHGFMTKNGRDKFRPCIVFPIFDEQGNIVQLYGRKISKSLKSGRFHEWLNDTKLVFWNIEGIRHQNDIILCKGLMDALTFWVHGYRNVTATYDLENFSDAHAKQLADWGIKRVYLPFRHDELGNFYTKSIAKILKHYQLVPVRMSFPGIQDPNDFARTGDFKTVFMDAEIVENIGVHRIAIQSTKKPLESTVSDNLTLDSPLPSSERKVLPEANTSPLNPVVKVKEETLKVDKLSPSKPRVHLEENDPKVADEDPSKPKAQVKGEDVYVQYGLRSYRIRGLFRNLSVTSMRVNLRIARGDLIFVDQLELYASRQRSSFAHQAALELGVDEAVVRSDLGRLILELEKLQDQRIEKTLDVYEMSDRERESAMTYLQDPNLMTRIAEDLDASGLIGETHNKLVGYLAMVSRKLAKPLAVLVQSTSAAGKSTLLETLLSFMPAEETMKYSSITPQSLYYMADKGIRHKVLAVSEDEGASRASYSLKLLQSEGELMISSTGGDSNGLASKEYKVEGPVCIAMTTTAIDIDEELLNRCIVLTVDETRTQTKAIHEIQRQNQTLEGILKRKQFEATLNVHRNAQRLLRPVYVVNPYAPQLTFLDEKTRLRRDHMKYLSLIQAVAFMHQFQRPTHSKNVGDETLEYIEVTLDDIRIANQLAHHVLGTTLDELPPQTRKLLEIIHTMVKDECRSLKIQRSEYHFTRKTLREYSQWGDTQLKIHLKRLVEQEYLALNVVKRKHFFECLYNGEGQHSSRFLMGLIDIDQIQKPRLGSNVKSFANDQAEVGAKAS